MKGPTALTCRVYHRRDGRVSPCPIRKDVRDALHIAMTIPGKAPSYRPTAVEYRSPHLSPLPDTDGFEHTRPADAPATLVVFTCNHCPYALAWHDRSRRSRATTPTVACGCSQINSNDAANYPRDSLEAMRERVAAGELADPYLHDETQEVARAWGAKTTPDCFVTDAGGRRLPRRAGCRPRDPSLNAAWLREALDAVLAGDRPARAETKPVGCSIKWKQ